jgi:pimeloyl-ACP methyl ester carboxylesterase
VTAARATERVLEIDGLRINVREAGEGSPVCLINGIGANVRMFAALQERMAGHRTIAFDAPGTGASGTPPIPLSMTALADLTAQLMHELGHEQVDVIGFSYGGGVAQQLARDHPDLVRRMVLVATSCGFGGVPGDPAALASVLTPLRYYSPRINALTTPLMGVGRAARDPEVVAAQGAARLASPPSPVGYLWQVLAGAWWTSWPWLTRIGQPVLVIMGGRDRLVPAVNGALLAARLPRARLIVVPDEDHHILVHPAPAVVDAIHDFLSSPTADESEAWDRATEVGKPLPTAGGMLPWGAASAAFRALVP